VVNKRALDALMAASASWVNVKLPVPESNCQGKPLAAWAAVAAAKAAAATKRLKLSFMNISLMLL
jgi:hypothetical protein